MKFPSFTDCELSLIFAYVSLGNIRGKAILLPPPLISGENYFYMKNVCAGMHGCAQMYKQHTVTNTQARTWQVVNSFSLK